MIAALDPRRPAFGRLCRLELFLDGPYGGVKRDQMLRLSIVDYSKIMTRLRAGSTQGQQTAPRGGTWLK